MERQPSHRGAELATRLREVAAALIAVVEPIDGDHWRHVPGPGVWSIGKEAEHVAEAAIYHQWIVRLTIGQKVPSRRPAIERAQTTTNFSTTDVIAMIRERTDQGAGLLLGLTDEQLDLPTKPPRARGQTLAVTIGRVLIGHYDIHRAEIEAKLRGDLREEGGLLSMPAAGMPIGGEDVRELIDADRHGR